MLLHNVHQDNNHLKMKTPLLELVDVMALIKKAIMWASMFTSNKYRASNPTDSSVISTEMTFQLRTTEIGLILREWALFGKYLIWL